MPLLVGGDFADFGDLGTTIDSSEIEDDSIVNVDINSAAAIAYSKLNLTGSIDNDDIAVAAAIAQSKIDGLVAALAGKQAVVAGVSDTEIGYLANVTSDIQAQIDTLGLTLDTEANITNGVVDDSALDIGVSQAYGGGAIQIDSANPDDLFLITAIEFKTGNGSILATLAKCGLFAVDANPPTIVSPPVVALTKEQGSLAASTTYKITTIFSNLIRGSDWIFPFVTHNNTLSLRRDVVTSQALQQGYAWGGSDLTGEGSWANDTNGIYLKVYYRKLVVA